MSDHPATNTSGEPADSPTNLKSAEWSRDNCYALALRRLRKNLTDDEREWWGHVKRICEMSGAEQRGVLRRTFPTELTEGAVAPAPQETK